MKNIQKAARALGLVSLVVLLAHCGDGGRTGEQLGPAAQGSPAATPPAASTSAASSAPSLSSTPPSSSSPVAQGTLGGNANAPVAAPPQVVASKIATEIHAIPSDSPMRIRLVLRPPHREELYRAAHDVHVPGSGSYRRFFSFDQWKARHAPAVSDLNLVESWARANGLRPVYRYESNLMLVLDGSVADVQRALGIKLSEYQHAGQHFFSNDVPITLPNPIRDLVTDVTGLNSFRKVRALHSLKPQDEAAPRVPKLPYLVKTHTGRDGTRGARVTSNLAFPGTGTLEPPDIMSSEGYDYAALAPLSHCCNPLNNPNGSPPQTSIGILGNNSVNDSDISTFLTKYGLAGNIDQVQINGPSCCDGEMTLDIEYTAALANNFGPNINTAHIYAFEGGGTLISDLLDAYQEALSEHKALVYSTSFGSYEGLYGSGGFLGIGGNPDISDFLDVTSSLALMGSTIVAAAGDHGANDDCNNLSVQYPASDPNVIAVGGTTLTMTPVNGIARFMSESSWTGTGCGTRDYDKASNNGGGDGGCSNVFAQPPWQKLVGALENSCPAPGFFQQLFGFEQLFGANDLESSAYKGGSIPTTNDKLARMLPDISLNAGTGQARFYQGQWDGGANGTSVGAPELAAFFAQENSYLDWISIENPTNGAGTITGGGLIRSPVGIAGPALYQVQLSNGSVVALPAPHNPYYDTTSGCNGGEGIIGYCAQSGYDLATGWGSPNMLQLAWAINFNLVFGGWFNTGGATAPVVPATVAFNPSWLGAVSFPVGTTQTLNFNISGGTQGIAGFTAQFGSDPGDPKSHATPGSGDSFYSGPDSPGLKSGSFPITNTGAGCQTAFVRVWDNVGASTLASYKVCFSNCTTSCSDGSACSTASSSSSCVCTHDSCPPPACSPSCSTGSVCNANGDCASSNCVASVCQPPTCSPHCNDGSSCGSNADCGSTVCSGNKCQPPACAPRCDNGTSCGANTDCGSLVCSSTNSCQPPACAPKCNDGSPCGNNSDCASFACVGGSCRAPSCAPSCNQGAPCGASGDCGSKSCVNGTCAAPTCAPSCAPGSSCNNNGDCSSHACTNNVCGPPPASTCSPKCTNGQICANNGDCESFVCTGGTCRAPACSPTCNQGAACGANGDCGSRVCSNGSCQAPACSPRCASNAPCNNNGDCTSHICQNSRCR